MTAPKIYKKIWDKMGRLWIVSSDDVYVWIHTNPKGLNGTRKRFHLNDGTTLIVRGPWLSNPESLKLYTGVTLNVVSTKLEG